MYTEDKRIIIMSRKSRKSLLNELCEDIGVIKMSRKSRKSLSNGSFEDKGRIIMSRESRKSLLNESFERLIQTTLSSDHYDYESIDNKLEAGEQNYSR